MIFSEDRHRLFRIMRQASGRALAVTAAFCPDLWRNNRAIQAVPKAVLL
jgi:hypothetical protein